MYKQNEIAKSYPTRATTGATPRRHARRNGGVHPSVKSDPLLTVPDAIAGEAVKACVLHQHSQSPKAEGPGFNLPPECPFVTSKLQERVRGLNPYKIGKLPLRARRDHPCARFRPKRKRRCAKRDRALSDFN